MFNQQSLPNEILDLLRVDPRIGLSDRFVADFTVKLRLLRVTSPLEGGVSFASSANSDVHRQAIRTLEEVSKSPAVLLTDSTEAEQTQHLFLFQGTAVIVSQQVIRHDTETPCKKITLQRRSIPWVHLKLWILLIHFENVVSARGVAPMLLLTRGGGIYEIQSLGITPASKAIIFFLHCKCGTLAPGYCRALEAHFEKELSSYEMQARAITAGRLSGGGSTARSDGSSSGSPSPSGSLRHQRINPLFDLHEHRVVKSLRELSGEPLRVSRLAAHVPLDRPEIVSLACFPDEHVELRQFTPVLTILSSEVPPHDEQLPVRNQQRIGRDLTARGHNSPQKHVIQRVAAAASHDHTGAECIAQMLIIASLSIRKISTMSDLQSASRASPKTFKLLKKYCCSSMYITQNLFVFIETNVASSVDLTTGRRNVSHLTTRHAIIEASLASDLTSCISLDLIGIGAMQFSRTKFSSLAEEDQHNVVMAFAHSLARGSEGHQVALGRIQQLYRSDVFRVQFPYTTTTNSVESMSFLIPSCMPNCDAYLHFIEDHWLSYQAKVSSIDCSVPELRCTYRMYRSMDPHSKGFILKEDFVRVFRSLCGSDEVAERLHRAFALARGPRGATQWLQFPSFLAAVGTLMVGSQRQRAQFLFHAIDKRNCGFICHQDLHDAISQLTNNADSSPIWGCFPSHRSHWVPEEEFTAEVTCPASMAAQRLKGLNVLAPEGATPSWDCAILPGQPLWDASLHAMAGLAICAAFDHKLAASGAAPNDDLDSVFVPPQSEGTRHSHQHFLHQRAFDLTSGEISLETWDQRLAVAKGKEWILEVCPEVFSDLRRANGTQYSTIARAFSVARLRSGLVGGTFAGLRGSRVPLCARDFARSSFASPCAFVSKEKSFPTSGHASGIYESADGCFLLQFLDEAKAIEILEFLPKYHYWVTKTPKSMLLRYLGLFAVTYTDTISRETVVSYFSVALNPIPPASVMKDISHVTFVRGSLAKQFFGGEGGDGNDVDGDFTVDALPSDLRLDIPRAARSQLVSQVKSDVDFLAKYCGFHRFTLGIVVSRGHDAASSPPKEQHSPPHSGVFARRSSSPTMMVPSPAREDHHPQPQPQPQPQLRVLAQNLSDGVMYESEETIGIMQLPPLLANAIVRGVDGEDDEVPPHLLESMGFPLESPSPTLETNQTAPYDEFWVPRRKSMQSDAASLKSTAPTWRCANCGAKNNRVAAAGSEFLRPCRVCFGTVEHIPQRMRTVEEGGRLGVFQASFPKPRAPKVWEDEFEVDRFLKLAGAADVAGKCEALHTRGNAAVGAIARHQCVYLTSRDKSTSVDMAGNSSSSDSSDADPDFPSALTHRRRMTKKKMAASAIEQQVIPVRCVFFMADHTRTVASDLIGVGGADHDYGRGGEMKKFCFTLAHEYAQSMLMHVMEVVGDDFL